MSGSASALRMPAALVAWFEHRGWRPFPFQREVWQAYARGDSGLLHATTGSGKTYSVWFAALIEALRGGARRPKSRPYTVLWITPMRALASDTARALAEPLADLGLDWTVGQRTGEGVEKSLDAKRLSKQVLPTFASPSKTTCSRMSYSIASRRKRHNTFKSNLFRCDMALTRSNRQRSVVCTLCL
jgi:ATP-dependent Lhr-like helicase